jgi:hypothetical protein
MEFPMELKRAGSQPSGKGPADWFTGTVRIDPLFIDNPTPHIGQVYNLTACESANLDHYARVFTEVLGRTIRYRDMPVSPWSEKLHRHQSNRFQRPMIETAPISPHAVIIPVTTA